MVKEVLMRNAMFFHPFLRDRIEDCKIDGPSVLLIRLHDGSIYLYDDFERSIVELPRDPNSMTDQEWRTEFARRLRRLMLVKGISQNDLVERTGMTQSMISRYMTGKSEPSARNLYKIARVLECSTDEFKRVEW
jgi:DNA-binding Xre family transcriptional regulator